MNPGEYPSQDTSYSQFCFVQAVFPRPMVVIVGFVVYTLKKNVGFQETSESTLK